MKTCLCGLAARQITVMSELLDEMDASFESWAPNSQRRLPTPTDVTRVLPTRVVNWNQLIGITHRSQQRVDSGQERFSNGMLTHGTVL